MWCAVGVSHNTKWLDVGVSGLPLFHLKWPKKSSAGRVLG